MSGVTDGGSDVIPRFSGMVGGFDTGYDYTLCVVEGPELAQAGTSGIEKTLIDISGPGEIDLLSIRLQSAATATYKIYIDGIEVHSVLTPASNTNEFVLLGTFEYINAKCVIKKHARPLRFASSFKVTIASTAWSYLKGSYRIDL